jgi:hypothetical protein
MTTTTTVIILHNKKQMLKEIKSKYKESGNYKIGGLYLESH